MKPRVSVLMITYKHEVFIAEAIRGVLMQKVDFEVELIIADDNSPDNTERIVNTFSNHPKSHWIKYTKHKENKGIMPNLKWGFNKTEGEYIALCEGDDYWIDPYKLQKQVDFLEANPDYGLIHTDYDYYYQEEDRWIRQATKAWNRHIETTSKKEFFYAIIDVRYQIRTATAMLRRSLLQKIPKNNVEFPMGDTPLWLDLLQLSKIKYLDEVSAVYRILPNSASRSNTKAKDLSFNLSILDMRIYYCYKYNFAIPLSLQKKYNDRLLHYLSYDPNHKPLYALFNPSFSERLAFNGRKLALIRGMFKFKRVLNKYIKAFRSKFKILF